MPLARSRLGSLLALAGLLVVATVYRLPPLMNAGALNSDAAIVGLQGQHIIHGEVALQLWGAGYQGALDSALAGIAIALLGMRPVAVFAAPFVGLLAMAALAFDVVRRRLGPAGAALCVLPLVIASPANNSPMIYVMRQTLALILTVAVWFAVCSARPRLRVGVPVAAMLVAVYVDFFAVVSLPAIALLLVDPERVVAIVRAWWKRAVAAGAALGVVAIAIGIIPLARLARNAALLFGTCLPFAVGARVFRNEAGVLVAQPWSPPAAFVLVQIGAALVFLAALGYGVRAALAQSTPPALRKLALVGTVASACTVAGFLVSAKPSDMWSVRYLAPIFWFAPYMLAPAVERLRLPRAAWVLAPYWVTSFVGGWTSYGLYVDGARPRIDARASAGDERALELALSDAGVHAAEAQYWLAYRLTYLFAERIVVVPLDRRADRYPPYRRSVDEAPVRALLFHPSEPRAKAEDSEALLRERGIAFERRELAGFTVLLVRK